MTPLMLGFLLAGLWLAREGRPVVGVLVCTVGAMIKVPAFVGVVYIGWGWLGDDVSVEVPGSGRPRWRPGSVVVSRWRRCRRWSGSGGAG